MSEAVARRVRELRKSQNMTQNELAERLHVTRQAVSNWEMGKTAVSIEYLTKLSDIFGVTTDEILYGETRKSEYTGLGKQRRYIICSLACGAVLLLAVVLELTLRPILNYLVETTYVGIYYFLYRYAVDVFGAAAAGGIIPALISIKKDVRLYGGARKLALFIGVFCIAVWFFVCVGTMFGFIKAPILVDLAMGRFAPITVGHFALPFLFGIGMFLGLNR